MSRKDYFLSCIGFLLNVFLFAQEANKKFNFVSMMEDIPKVGIYHINQDDDGFMWIATNGAGLYRYDGIDYNSYRYILNDSTSLSSSVVYCTFLDSKHRFWVGTEEGLNLYNQNNDQFLRIPNSKFEATYNKSISVRNIIEDKQGNIFVGTFGAGLFKITGDEILQVDKIQSSKLNIDVPITIEAIAIDNDGKIYTGTNLGIQEYDSNKNILKPTLFSKELYVKDHIKSLIIDENNNIWAGATSKGIYKANYKDNDTYREIEHFSVSENPFFSITSLKDETLLFGTENDGLYHINQQGKILNHHKASNKDEKSLLSSSIWSLYQDKDNKIWLGYYNKGVAVYDPLYDKFKGLESLYNNPNSLQASSVTSIVEDKSGKIWVGMDGGGIDVIDKKSNQYTHINTSLKSKYSGLTSDYIQAIFIDSKENIWAGSWDQGIFFLKNGTKHFVNKTKETTNGDLQSDVVVSFDEDSKGTIWISTYHSGLHSYNPTTAKFTHYNTPEFQENGISNSDSWKVLVDYKDNIWLGTTNGLFKIVQKSNGAFSINSMKEKMEEKYHNVTTANHILSLYESSDKNIWIGTKGAGLCKYNIASNSFIWYNKLNGLILENVCGIIECNSQNIWVSGNSGIVKINTEFNEFTNFTVNDGLLSNDFNMNSSYKNANGEIYFGGYDGVDYFKPNTIDINKSENFLYLSELKIFNKKVLPTQENSPLNKIITETDSISLNSKQSVFTIEYSGINYTRPEKNEYAYYLAGYENTWNYVGGVKSATYTNLDPGNYIFKLKSSNNDGVWNAKPLELKITILPPWWKTSWALIGYLTIFFIGLYLLNKVTQSRIRTKQLTKYEEEKRIQEQNLNEKKFQFFTNISHEFRTPLTLIMNPLHDIMSNEKLFLPEGIKSKHRIIQKNTARLHRLVNELLDFRKLELNKISLKAKEFNLVDLTHDVLSYFKEEAHVKYIDLDVSTDEEEVMVWADIDMLEKVIFNIISNAFKATPEGGTISVALYTKDDLVTFPLVSEHYQAKAVELVISDTGIGIPKDEISKMFERFYQVDSLNKTYYGGTGIGLEVVQSFVELHKGKIEVASEVEDGTTFRIILPKGKEHLKDDEIYSDVYEQNKSNKKYLQANIPIEKIEADQPKEALHPYSVLIVEDNIELRNYLKSELKNHYRVLTANHGKEGYDLAIETLPDVIITDVIMPEMNGFELCRCIKTDIRTSHIPLLMLTAKAKIDDRIEGIEIGADAYMVKPFDMRLLKLRLSQLITSRQLIFNKYFSAISDLPANANTTSLDKEFIQKALNYINQHIGDSEISVESLASHLNLSRSQVYRKIKALTDQTANEFIRNIRLHKAKVLIQAGNTNISEVSYTVGFSTSSYFTKCFKNYFGVLPTQIEVEADKEE
ncbi:signal transduction histidine kinase [Galbibacter orientalis DSM 19592]|uniref:histidine kinase n=1 Tax=Galbibacter orientalis DSM 19592 TaxID=926559 RepID=I3CB46_9FLAO|nr:hybrid sensor histidine kinase/response regulator transcription factor [Galbibacter orientalis]EIJ40839.1 signal transduction histidine kinase [Galbibacter orientalis DSM 19592]